MPTIYTIDPDNGGPDFGQVASLTTSTRLDFLRAANNASSWTQGFGNGSPGTGLEVITAIGPDNTGGTVTIKWQGVTLRQDSYADLKNVVPFNYEVTVSDTGEVSFTHNFGGPSPTLSQIPGTEWQTTDNSDWVHWGATSGSGVTNSGTTASQTPATPPCLTAGTRVTCARGTVLVEDLKAGDRVWTLDHGYQTLRWIGRQTMQARHLADKPKLRPFKIAKDALGPNMPNADLWVSRQHRM